MTTPIKKQILILLAFVALSAGSVGQDTLSKKELKLQKKSFLLNDRPWTLEIPIWIPGFVGDFSYGDVSLEGEDGGDPVDPGDPDDDEKPNWLDRIFSTEWYLKFVFITRLTYEKDRFLAQMDGIAGSVGYKVKFNWNDREIAQANFRTINVRLFGGYKLIETNSKSNKFRYKLFPYIGVRSHFQRISSELNGIVNRLNVHPHWTEPIFGIRNEFILKRWKVILQADYGGFFVSSKWSTQATVTCYYRSGTFTSIKVGWNLLQLNHIGTIRSQELRLKVLLMGPSVGVAFHF